MSIIGNINDNYWKNYRDAPKDCDQKKEKLVMAQKYYETNYLKDKPESLKQTGDIDDYIRKYWGLKNQ